MKTTLLAIALAFIAFASAQAIVYPFDEVEVLYAARFTVYPTSTSVPSWAEEIAVPGEAITITYGIVILKTAGSPASTDNEAVNSGPLPSNEAVGIGPLPPSKAVSSGVSQEEWLKAEGSRGSKRLLSNGMLNSFNSESTQITESRTQLWTAKKLVGNNIEKDFTEPVYNAYLFRKLINGELQPTHVCFKKGGNYDGFWSVPGDHATSDCYSTKEFIKEIGDDKQSAGTKPVNAPAVQAATPCPEEYSCLEKQDGGERGCVILASYSCSDREKLCFKCTQTQPQCVFNGEGCCNKVNPNICAALPVDFACEPGFVARVKACASDCSAIGACATAQSPSSPKPAPAESPSPTPTSTPTPTPTVTPAPTPTPTPSPSPEPSPSPSPEPSPSPSPSATPSEEPSPSPSPPA
ncbi:MAG: hypothetical protein V1834_02545 [Candidatus Micrarchaeota archaeon]